MLQIPKKEYDKFYLMHATEEEISIILDVFAHTNFEVSMDRIDENTTSFYSEDFDGLYGTLDLGMMQEVSFRWENYSWSMHHYEQDKIRTVRSFMHLLWGKYTMGAGYDNAFEIFNGSEIAVTHIIGQRIDDILKRERDFFNTLFNDRTKHLAGVVLLVWGKDSSFDDWGLVADVFLNELDKSDYSLTYNDYLYQGIWDSAGEELVLSIFANYSTAQK